MSSIGNASFVDSTCPAYEWIGAFPLLQPSQTVPQSYLSVFQSLLFTHQRTPYVGADLNLRHHHMPPGGCAAIRGGSGSGPSGWCSQPQGGTGRNGYFYKHCDKILSHVLRVRASPEWKQNSARLRVSSLRASEEFRFRANSSRCAGGA